MALTCLGATAQPAQPTAMGDNRQTRLSMACAAERTGPSFLFLFWAQENERSTVAKNTAELGSIKAVIYPAMEERIRDDYEER